MTSDTPTDAGSREQAEASTAAQPPRKPARRRATRAAAAPKAEAATPESAAPEAPAPEPTPAPAETAGPAGAPAAAPRADIVLPERSSAPDDAPAGAASLSDIVLPQGPGGRADDTAEEAPQKPARTRRRATRATGAQRTEPATPAPETPAAATPEAAPDAEPEQPAAAPKGRKRAATTRSRRAVATTEATTAEPAGTEQAGTEQAGTETVAADAGQAGEEPTAPAKSAAKKAPARKSTAKGGARRSAAAGDATGAEAGTATSTAPKGRRTTAAEPATKAAETAEQTAEQTAPRSPAARGGGSAVPRLATTAVLFQAPDLSGRRSRRAQAPAGPPRPHDTPMFASAEPAPAAEQADVSPVTPPRTSRTAKTTEEATAKAPRARRSTRSTAQAAPAATRSDEARGDESRATQTRAAETPAGEAPVVEPTVDEARVDAIAIEAAAAEAAPADLALSEDEVAAVEEVGVIESELVAEGVELVDLGPEDLDDEDAEDDEIRPRRRRRRGGRGRRGGRRADGETEPGDEGSEESESGSVRETDGEDDDQSDEQGDRADERADESEDEGGDSASGRRRRRRRRGTRAERAEAAVARTRDRDEVTALKGSTRLEAKRQRRREGRDAGRRRQIITESEFLARRESVTRSMVVRERDGRTQIAVLEDGVLVEHYVSQQSQASMVGNVYLGRVQNVLPSMEAAFVDVGKGRNAVLYAGEVNWDAAGLEGGQPRRIEEALKSGDSVLVQVTKDPIGHKGARLTSQVTLAGRYLVFVPGGGMTGISRKLPDTERSRLKKILRDVVPEGAGVIVRTAAEGASETELRADVERLEAQWASIQKKSSSASAPALLQGEPDLAIRVVRDIFNDDFSSLQIQGGAWDEISQYVDELAPDLRERVTKWTENTDVFAVHRVDEQLAKGMDRKVWLPSGGSLVIDRTEAMTVVDVNTGKFTGAGGTLEETVTRNNLEAAEEIVRQLRLRDIGGIVVIDFIDMVLESNRDLVLRRLVECLGRDRTKHQVAEVTSLGLVQMTRKRVGQGLVEAFSETCEHCKGRGFIVHSEPIEKGGAHQHGDTEPAEGSKRSRRKRGGKQAEPAAPEHAPAEVPTLPEDRSEAREAVKATLATIAAAAAHAHEHEHDQKDGDQDAGQDGVHDAVAVPPEAAPEQPARVSPDSVIELPERGDEPARKGAGTASVPEPGAGEAAEQGLTDS